MLCVLYVCDHSLYVGDCCVSCVWPVRSRGRIVYRYLYSLRPVVVYLRLCRFVSASISLVCCDTMSAHVDVDGVLWGYDPLPTRAVLIVMACLITSVTCWGLPLVRYENPVTHCGHTRWYVVLEAHFHCSYSVGYWVSVCPRSLLFFYVFHLSVFRYYVLYLAVRCFRRQFSYSNSPHSHPCKLCWYLWQHTIVVLEFQFPVRVP